MRVLSLGSALPDIQVDNYDWASAPSFFDYDAMVVDPAGAVSKFVEGLTGAGGSFRSYVDETVEDGPTTAAAVGLADLLRRRAEETGRLLARGGVVVCFAYPDVAHPRVSGFTGCHRYYWLPAPPGCSYGAPFIKRGEGTDVTATDYQPPFADYLERFRTTVVYRAVFAEGAAGFGEQARVFGRSLGGAAVAVDIAVGGGRVIFLPALPDRTSNAERVPVATAIVNGIRNLLLLEAEAAAPDWLSKYPLPGIEDAERRVGVAETRLEAAEAELAEARNELRGIDRYRRLLWQEGKYGLDLPVRDALALLGFTGYSRADEPAVFGFEGETVLVESQGSSRAVGMDPHYRLRQRLERKIADEGKRHKGLIVVNGYRELAPIERPRQYEDTLRVAAESMRYCVVEATRLFEAARAALSGDQGTAKAFARRLIETEGAVVDDERQERDGAEG